MIGVEAVLPEVAVFLFSAGWCPYAGTKWVRRCLWGWVFRKTIRLRVQPRRQTVFVPDVEARSASAEHPPGPRRGFHVPHTRVTAGLGALFTPRPRGAQPTGPIPPAVARPLFQGPGPIAPVHIPSPEAVYYGASSRVHSRSPARPSPRPGHPWMEQGQPWAHSPGSAPRRPGACSARRGGRRASSTRPELPHDRHRRTSYPAAHSLMCDLVSHVG